MARDPALDGPPFNPDRIGCYRPDGSAPLGIRSARDYILTTLDPGGAATGWSHFTVDRRAFSRPQNKVLKWVKDWDHGEWRGTETQMCLRFRGHMRSTMQKYGWRYCNRNYKILTEDFDLTQMVGGKDLLSPVRINAVVDWECDQHAIELFYQARQMRSGVTKERLKLFGFESQHGRVFRKDEFAAMQHAITYLRGLKQKSRTEPWKLWDGNESYWDCTCSEGRKCDILHPLS